MYAVRQAFSRPEALRALVAGLVERGAIDASAVNSDDPLGFLLHEEGARSLTDAAYRYAVHEPGCSLVLSGTGSVDHLRDNIRSVSAPPLPAADVARLEAIFGGIDDITGN
jgi:aryl-alcohol dehydrogenase-like predicted oxidoreductase